MSGKIYLPKIFLFIIFKYMRGLHVYTPRLAPGVSRINNIKGGVKPLFLFLGGRRIRYI